MDSVLWKPKEGKETFSLIRFSSLVTQGNKCEFPSKVANIVLSVKDKLFFIWGCGRREGGKGREALPTSPASTFCKLKENQLNLTTIA